MERDCKVSAVLTDDSSRMTVSEGEMEDIGILKTDSLLEPHKDHFKCRVKRYLEQKSLFEKFEGGLEEFARGLSSITDYEVLFHFWFQERFLGWNTIILLV